MTAHAHRILVLDGDMIPALSAVRALGRLSIEVNVASSAPDAIASYSRYCRTTLIYPDPLTQEAEFLAWCADLLERNIYQLIFPITERTVVPLQTLLKHPGGGRITIAPTEALAVALNKDRTLALAAQLGIPAPRSVEVDNLVDLEQTSQGMSMPLVLKPVRSIGADGTERRQLSVAYAFNSRELQDKAEQFLRYGPLLLQEYVGGVGVGIELIADRGEVVFAFQHQRLHEVPLTGGGSSLRKSVAIEPELLEASRKLMAALKWHGVAMVEFKWIPSERRLSLMEINGRFWGSLPLAIAAGADFPVMLYELYTQGKVTPQPPARQEVYCRKISSDLYWHEMVLRRDGPPELVTFPSKGSMLRDALRVFSPRHYFDVQQWRDPKPGLVDLARIWREQTDRVKRLLADKRERQAQRQAWRNGEVARRLGQARQILFVCYGNINRSALAERCFVQRHLKSSVKAVSAGFHEEAGRPADPVMVEVAGNAQVDLCGWASHRIDAAMLADSDIVFVMEQKHLQRLRQAFPQAADKAFLMNAGPMVGGSLEILDPYGKARGVYEQVCHQVIRCVDHLAEILQKNARP
jgi:protein-tyrosine-phosphatase/biotin carboxylase